MYSSVCSGGLHGLSSYIAAVEIDVSRALPGFDMVGKLSGEVKEARERVKVALKNCGIELPPVKITVNISPADIPKSGTAFDLPIALGVMNCLGHIPDKSLDGLLMIGELGLMGDIRPVNGVLPILLEAKKNGIARCMIPAGNATEASYVEGMDLLAVESLAEAVSIMGSLTEMESHIWARQPDSDPMPEEEEGDDYADVIGQDACIRAATVAAAGFHHMLMIGPPGAGKTMIAKRLAGILPTLNRDESLEVSTIYSVSGLLSSERPFVKKRPFLAPHHTTTAASMTGGGVYPRPGIMSLAHKGILFLDEFPEYDRECIEILREPLEERKIQISRARSSHTFPADFMLVAAANPCPCGYYPDRNICNCPDSMIARYRGRISGPIRDRIDIVTSVARIDADRMIDTDRHKDTHCVGRFSTMELREAVGSALSLQEKRYEGCGIRYNSELTPGMMEEHCYLGKKEKEYMKDVYDRMNLTARSYHKVLKVARTIADLDGEKNIQIPHLSEAVCYRGINGPSYG